MHAVDWYTTFAGLAGASVNQTGPLPVDGINIWDSLRANETDPNRHMLIQYASVAEDGSKLAQPQGVVRRGDWKLITGYPGWGRPGWDGHFPLPAGPDTIEGWEEAHTHASISRVAPVPIASTITKVLRASYGCYSHDSCVAPTDP
eukprot:COSAG02_NODE_3612_length_6484_cov_22.155834_4_plen_146_part_00